VLSKTLRFRTNDFLCNMRQTLNSDFTVFGGVGLWEILSAYPTRLHTFDTNALFNAMRCDAR